MLRGRSDGMDGQTDWEMDRQAGWTGQTDGWDRWDKWIGRMDRDGQDGQIDGQD